MKVMARFVLLGLAWGTSALAVETGLRPNPAEMLRLPAYCQAKFNLPRGTPEWNAWRDRIGENFNDIHHYCAGLNYMNRYWAARSKQDRGYYLQRAISNFDYMAKAEKPGFLLRAELYSNRGEVFRLMGRPGEAVKELNQALAADPRNVKTYLQLADLQVAGKAPARALETVSEGLRYVPDSTALQRRYLELGGQKPFPDPVVAKAAKPVAASSGADEATAQPVEAAGAEATSDTAAPIQSPPPIGTPNNPYCRFCPPE